MRKEGVSPHFQHTSKHVVSRHSGPYPAFLLASGTLLMPTSMTVAPGLSHSPLTKPAFPIAATTMSACEKEMKFAPVMAGGGQCRKRTSRTVVAMSAVREWHTVTVAFSASRRWATGMPTMLERPMTTARFPSIGML